ncbi:hypothetical protein WMF31_19750 [Sorangium sp. So ce1036]|uniref:hypothetical protein n=1 Tax=Sorangium sp. So ce1036 TaxID=3133328 RepID=UPI003F08D3D0
MACSLRTPTALLSAVTATAAAPLLTARGGGNGDAPSIPLADIELGDAPEAAVACAL